MNAAPLFSRVVALCAALAIGSFQSETIAATNIVVNGGFETGDLGGWTQSGNMAFTGVTDLAPFPHTGTYGVFAGPQLTLGLLSQNLPTTAGQTYQLDYWLRNSGGTPNQFQVSWNGNIIASQTQTNAAQFDYTLFSVSGLLATSASTPLSFGFRQDPGFWGLDDVSVVQTSPGLRPPTLERR